MEPDTQSDTPSAPHEEAGAHSTRATNARDQQPAKPDNPEKPARGAPGSFDQPEPHPDVMPREGGPHPEQTAEVPLGSGDEGLPSGARGHNSPPVRRKPGA
ncbi:hypothetical protein [Paraburkholderia tropica]|uniref:MARCKS-like protein n=1 Tax=Paraburkholderia tropica TaxID=92647 RepID=A0ABX5MHR9_9BURK|nr:hypothetical protein [Paraburkholderia tropica]MDE1143990.1 hypothetical protein [Paraburkholderia tropica]PXX11461.1 hypothetical protein C7400_11928 [Paraburkholderia tropica]PZW76124.1 hypothetical protein C7399_11928 [Paraburkholderia tropica]